MKKRTVGINCKKKQLIAVKQPDGSYIRQEIRSLHGRSLWSNFIIFFNSIVIGEEFTRHQLLRATYEENIVDKMRRDMTTVDAYRCLLTRLEIIEVVKSGIYRKIYNLPSHLTITDVRKASKEMTGWKKWFIPLHKKLGIKEKDLK